jgi:predicted methyltransferase
MFRIKTSSKKEIEKIFHLLYDNSNFYMTRKFNKFNHYVNTEVTQLIAEHRNA